jgi:hypothetical protein
MSVVVALLLLLVQSVCAQTQPSWPAFFTGTARVVSSVVLNVANDTDLVVAQQGNSTLFFNKAAQTGLIVLPDTSTAWMVLPNSQCQSLCFNGVDASGASCSVFDALQAFTVYLPLMSAVMGGTCDALNGPTSGFLFAFTDAPKFLNLAACVDGATGFPVFLDVRSYSTSMFITVQFSSFNLKAAPNPVIFQRPASC